MTHRVGTSSGGVAKLTAQQLQKQLESRKKVTTITIGNTIIPASLFARILACLDFTTVGKTRLTNVFFYHVGQTALSYAAIALPPDKLCKVVGPSSKYTKLPIDYDAVDPVNGLSLSSLRRQTDYMLKTFAFNQQPFTERSSHTRHQWIFEGYNETLQAYLNVKRAKMSLSQEDIWFERAFKGDLTFKDEEFKALNDKLKQEIYSVANIYSQERFVERLQKLGMKSEPVVLKGAAIVAPNMDVIAARKTLTAFLYRLRRDSILLTTQELPGLNLKLEEFQKDEGGLRSLLGKNYMEQMASKLGLKSIKFPKQFVVVEGKRETIELAVREGLGGLAIESQDCTVYSERIAVEKRLPSRREIEELVTLLGATCHLNPYKSGFVVAQDGIYVLNTDTQSLGDFPDYHQIETDFIDGIVAKEDHAWFKQLMKGKKKGAEKPPASEKPLAAVHYFPVPKMIIFKAAPLLSKVVCHENGEGFAVVLSNTPKPSNVISSEADDEEEFTLI